MVWLAALRERLRLSLWFIPALFALGAGALALALITIDHALATDQPVRFFAFSGSPEGARGLLSTIAQAMLTFTGLVFTITMLVLQLASNQLSPRVMRTFLRDRGNQAVLGLFVATFLFTLLVLREVRSAVDGSAPFVPAISVWVAFALLITCVGAFVYYIDHMAHAIRASTVIVNIWTETRAALERLYPERVGASTTVDEPDLGPPSVVIEAPRAGVIVSLDEGRLLDLTRDQRRALELLHVVGAFVPEHAPLLRGWGTWDDDSVERARASIGIGTERTVEQDPAFGFRQLVDIALRALSPGINDPTTAAQALDRLHDLLRCLATRAFPSPVRVEGDRVRLVLPRPSWDEYVELALLEIALAGREQPQVVDRLRRLLDDVSSVAPPDRRPALQRQLERLEGATSGAGQPAGLSL